MSSIDAGGPAFPLDFRLVEAMSRAIEVSKLDKNEKAEGLRRLGDSACGMTLRDYFIAHAPSEPQQWFSPVLPEREVPLPTFAQMYPDHTQDELKAYKCFNSDWMNIDDVSEERVRNYLFQREEQHKRSREYAAMAERERYIQWPAAWADAMLEARKK